MGNGGPNTAAGKAASARNALRHGLLSDTPLVTGCETQEDWQAHRDAVLAALRPQDHLQTCLAERAALLHWRLRRVGVAEMELLEYEALQLDQERARHPNSPLHADTDGWPLMRSMNVLECLTRYEAHLGRELARTMKSLFDLQSRPTPDVAADAKTENCETNSSPTPVPGPPASAGAGASHLQLALPAATPPTPPSSSRAPQAIPVVDVAPSQGPSPRLPPLFGLGGKASGTGKRCTKAASPAGLGGTTASKSDISYIWRLPETTAPPTHPAHRPPPPRALPGANA